MLITGLEPCEGIRKLQKNTVREAHGLILNVYNSPLSLFKEPTIFIQEQTPSFNEDSLLRTPCSQVQVISSVAS